MLIILSIILSYLIGAVSFSYLITKKIKKIDIRKTGSGNAGATNTQRILGTGPAIGVLFLDILKGIVCILIARFLLAVPDWAVVFSGFAAILGHDFPVYYGFKGGKGVATTIGVFFMIMPIEALIAGLVTLAVIALTRYVSLGSLIFLLLTPVLGVFFGTFSNAVLLIMFLITVLAYFQHRANIIRLIHGNENKIGHKKAQA
ncbi:glycerol-3-phosphate 1-O-acyltransferase PlsY [Sporolactobacillus spathodeae]|uniref:Glycerol-3-phosphate acyltransferase n=1 Tax=Sporolactobacillus spathodeae TaxID=1465502 RepID=A0ABS2Q7P1_9BACL|nr:glycerol-3-phosphate 1-O-acyltransferase PlsY [Sporolactobacillus spathodeae]MBM7657813.1 glycerol-3-phosphate acyltransferase PlsY [Sporolactobacillus spathodeae]